jgi:uncharacterized coiled-coil DUF342 family protein
MKQQVSIIDTNVGETSFYMEATAQNERMPFAQDIKHIPKRLSAVERKPDSETMPPRSEDKLESAITAMAQAMTLMAQGQARADERAEQVARIQVLASSKSLGERIKEWFPNVMMVAMLVFSATRFDAMRETKADTSMITLQNKVEQVEKRDVERKSEIEMWRTYVTSLVIELKSKGIKIPPMPKGE